MKAKESRSGFFERRALCVAVAFAWLLPGMAAAQQDLFALEEPVKPPPDPELVRELTEVRSEVEFGIGHVSKDSFRFGRYTGLEQEGLFGVLDIELNQRGPYDGDSTRYWRLKGSNLGLTSREATLEYGDQGNYKLFFEYDQIPTFRLDTARTIFDGAGSTNLTLPAGWVASGTTVGMAQLLPSLKRVDIEHERRRVGVGFAKELPRGWDFTTAYRYETKEGLKTVGAVIGNSGGNPRAVIVPEPIDYVTQQFDAVLGYADARMQFQVGYYLSLFKNENDSLTWQNPYSAITGWDASAGFPTGQGRLHLPPDNQFHQVSVLGGYNLTDRMRLTADLAFGRMTQDEPFLPYTVNPTLAASITQPLPRNSLDGRIDTTLFNLRLAARPTSKFYWNAGYRYDDRDNRTPRNEYVYIGGDSQTQNTAVTSDRRRFNEPYSYKEQKLKLDGGYQVAVRTDLTAGVERSEIQRTFSEREEAKENTFSLGFKRAFSDTLSGGVRLSRADRYGSTYHGDEPFLSGYSPGYTGSLAEEVRWENHPDLRKFHIADRERDKLALFAHLMPSEKWAVGFNANYLKDDYTASEMGLTKSDIHNYTLDATFLPAEATSLYAFYTYENLKSDQDGRAIRGGANKLPDSLDPARDWFVKHRDRVDTVGLGIRRTVIKNRLDVGADYVYAKSKGEVDVTTGAALTSAPLPPLITRLNSLSLYGKYKWKKDWSVKARYWVEKFDSTDWALDNVQPNTLANVITLGETSPDYTVHVIMLSLGYRF